ncbi:MAG: toxin-antitoxin system YwqK family antitoxin [Bacteroidota bacterium]
MIGKEKVNQYTNDSVKHGKWVTFFANGVIESEGYYKYGIKNGYFKDYFPDGTLKNVSKYINGEIQIEAVEVTKLDIKTEYYPDGKVKKRGGFKDNIPEGISRIYSTDGKVDSAKVYKNGIIIGDGIVDDNGMKQGSWKEYHDTGELKGEGKYIASQRIDAWKYYYKNGKVEQTGTFLKNETPDGEWIWYYDNGSKLREETFINGLRNGVMTEYTDSGTIVAKGEFVDDLEEGLWYYHEGDIVMEGSYKSGGREGEWKYIYDNGNLCFSGSFLDDNPDGRHKFFWDNGKIKDEGYYIMGKKEGDWFKYDYTGTLFLITTFKNGIEIKYDGVKIKPPTEDDSGE